MKCFVIGGLPKEGMEEDKIQQFRDDCVKIGKFLFENGHALIVCSPFKVSVDYWVLKGFYSSGTLKDNQFANIHYVDNDTVKSEINKLKGELKINSIKCIPNVKSFNNNSAAMQYLWLLCQLEALEECNFIITIGGKVDGAANMLLRLAESKRKVIVPLSFWDGAAAECFQRKQYELRDKLEEDYSLLCEHVKILESGKLSRLLTGDKTIKNYSKNNNEETLKFFISYSRARVKEADYVEVFLRRRNLHVFRDETDFGAGSSISQDIKEAIYSSNIFIAMWCNEYACSPWCFDELELALDRHDEEKMDLWILCLDETRIVPRRARDLVNYNVKSREDIDKIILSLLFQYDRI